jgi:ABC-2 type transport system ATP-binding protein
MIAGLRAVGVTVFLTTHFMDEAEALADRVAVIANGKIVATGTPENLGGRGNQAAEISFSLPREVSLGELPDAVLASLVTPTGTRLECRTESPVAVLGPLVRWAETRGFDLADLEVRRPSLEDIYLQLTESPG